MGISIGSSFTSYTYITSFISFTSLTTLISSFSTFISFFFYTLLLAVVGNRINLSNLPVIFYRTSPNCISTAFLSTFFSFSALKTSTVFLAVSFFFASLFKRL